MFSKCMFQSYWTQGKLISEPDCCIKSWLWRWGRRHFLLWRVQVSSPALPWRFHHRGYAEVSVLLWIRAHICFLQSPYILTLFFGSPCIAEQKSPAHCGVFVLVSARNTFLSKSFLCKIEYTLQIVELHVQISTLGSSALVIGNLPGYQGAICAAKHHAWRQVVFRIKGYGTLFCILFIFLGVFAVIR